jgi:Rne/Rng family ribonuclease
MAVEATRAMVTVDVNTGAEFSPGAAVTANVEAARELPRQLRLRGLGGQVAVDWAPLKKPERRRVEDTLKSAFRRDPVETTLAGWTPLGHFELQRKRERRPIAELLASLDRRDG